MSAKKDEPTAADKAFTKSDKHTLGELKLSPWTPERYIAGQNMNMLYPHVGAEGWDQFNRTKMYPGLVKDITICLWLCTIWDSPRFDASGKEIPEWTVEQADAAPKEAYKAAKKWAKNLGILIPDSPAFWAAYGKFADIIKQVNDSATQQKGSPADGNTEEEDDPKE